MKNTRLESNINENIVEEEIQLLTEMLLEGTKKITSTVTYDKIVELKKLADSKKYNELNEIMLKFTNGKRCWITCLIHKTVCLTKEVLTISQI